MFHPSFDDPFCKRSVVPFLQSQLHASANQDLPADEHPNLHIGAAGGFPSQHSLRHQHILTQLDQINGHGVGGHDSLQIRSWRSQADATINLETVLLFQYSSFVALYGRNCALYLRQCVPHRQIHWWRKQMVYYRTHHCAYHRYGLHWPLPGSLGLSLF